MAASGHDQLEVPVDFWDRPQVASALEARDIAGLFAALRRYCGASQTRIATTVGMTQSYVSQIMLGRQVVAAFAVLERIADGLAMPDEARMRLGLAPREVDAVRRRTALGVGLAGMVSPATLATLLQQSAAEAFEFTHELAATGVGRPVLDHLTGAIIELDRAYPWRPAAELFPIARTYRLRVQALINGKRTLAQARELYVQGAYLSHILADLAYDLDSPLAARAYAIDSQQLADQAGHNELYAWAADTLAAATTDTVAPAVLASDQPTKTINILMRGIARVPSQHPLAVRLRTRAARIYAQQGNRQRTLELLDEARQVCDVLPDTMSSRFVSDRAEHVACTMAHDAASAFISLQEWAAAERHARLAHGVVRWSPGRAALVQVNHALALAQLGSPEEAADRGRQALAIGRPYGDLLKRAGKLDSTLRKRYPKMRGTGDYHAIYEDISMGAS